MENHQQLIFRKIMKDMLGIASVFFLVIWDMGMIFGKKKVFQTKRQCSIFFLKHPTFSYFLNPHVSYFHFLYFCTSLSVQYLSLQHLLHRNKRWPISREALYVIV